jgi:hypothetical protein
MTIYGCVLFEHPDIPGENVWCTGRQQAETAARQHLGQLPAGYRLVHHLNPRLGIPHFHLVDPQGDPFYAHFFYSGRPMPARWQTAGRPFTDALWKQGFAVMPQFVLGFLEGLRAHGRRLPPHRFRRAFYQARHYRQTQPGFNTRLADIAGLVVLYRLGRANEPGVVLLGVLPAGVTAVGIPISPPATESQFEAESSGHGWAYQKARQEFLRGLLQDPNQPRFIKGWVRQEMRRLQQLAKGGSPGKRRTARLRGIPGFDVGHRRPGIHQARNFRLENASTNRARPGIARRLGLFPKYR